MKKQLKDVCEGFTKNIAQKDLSENNGKYPIFGASGIIKTIDFYISDKPYIGIVKDGSGVGRTNKYPAKSSLLGTMQYILPNQGIDLDYLMYGIRSLHLGENYSGAAIPHIYFKVYKNRTLDFPELAEQKQRSIVLNKIQDAINVKEKQLFELENIIQSEFVEMFGENPVESGKWKVAKWADKVRITNGRDYKKLVVKTGLYPVYGSGGDMGIRVDDYLCSENTVIIGRKGNIDKPIFVKEKFWNVDTAFGLNVDESEINPYYFFEHSKKYNYRSMDTGVTIPSLTKTALFELKLAIPPLDLQNQFAAFVQQIDKSKFVVKRQIADLQELLDSKMQEYFG